MTPAALQIYSFLMRQNIPFARFCHPAYQNREQWKQSFKRAKLDVFFPVCTMRCVPADPQLVMLVTAENTASQPMDWHPIPSSQLTALCADFQCTPLTLSPLGLLYDKRQRCRVVLDGSVPMETRWCLPPCSDTSSVLIEPEHLLQFLKAIPHKDCASDAPSDFSSDETKSGVNPLWIHEHFCEI